MLNTNTFFKCATNKRDWVLIEFIILFRGIVVKFELGRQIIGQVNVVLTKNGIHINSSVATE